MERKQSELQVISKAKDLCAYVMIATQKSPKQSCYKNEDQYNAYEKFNSIRKGGLSK